MELVFYLIIVTILNYTFGGENFNFLSLGLSSQYTPNEDELKFVVLSAAPCNSDHCKV
jgi:hypothetical protein